MPLASSLLSANPCSQGLSYYNPLASKKDALHRIVLRRREEAEAMVSDMVEKTRRWGRRGLGPAALRWELGAWRVTCALWLARWVCRKQVRVWSLRAGAMCVYCDELNQHGQSGAAKTAASSKSSPSPRTLHSATLPPLPSLPLPTLQCTHPVAPLPLTPGARLAMPTLSSGRC